MRFISFLASVILGIVVLSCTEEELIRPDKGKENFTSNVEFVSDFTTIQEFEDQALIRLDLDKISMQSGTIRIKLDGDAQLDVHFTLDQEVVNGEFQLNMIEGEDHIEFLVKRLTFESYNDLSIKFQLIEVSEGFKIGSNKIINILLPRQTTGQKENVEINFEDSFIHISENESSPFTVNLYFTGGPVESSEQIFVRITNPEGISFGVNYNTNPMAVMNEIVLPIQPGATSHSFQITPIDNNIVQDSYELKFELYGSGQLSVGDNSILTIRIEEDDLIEEDDPQEVQINSISDLRALFEVHNGEFWIPEDYFIEGIITSSSNVIDLKMAYIQDMSGGIAMLFSAEKNVYLGDKVRLNLKNATGQFLNGQKAITGINDLSGTLISENNHVIPEEITFSQLQSGQFSGKKVRINQVQFSEANGSTTYLGSRKITDEVTGGYVTTYQSAEFADYKLPVGFVSIVGIVGDWGRIMPQKYASDIIK